MEFCTYWGKRDTNSDLPLDHSRGSQPQSIEMASAQPLVWTTCLSTCLCLLWAGIKLPHLHLSPVCSARGRSRQPDKDRLSPFLGLQ